jgi:hypothetical protein
MAYDKAIGRHRLMVSNEGLTMHDYGHGAQIEYLDGWNEGCARPRMTLSVDELRDLRYLIDRALEAAGVRV